METLNSRATLCMGVQEVPCTLRQASDTRIRLNLNRNASISGAVIVVDHKRALAFDAAVVSAKGSDVTLSIKARHNLQGLVPARLSRARDIWKRT